MLSKKAKQLVKHKDLSSDYRTKRMYYAMYNYWTVASALWFQFLIIVPLIIVIITQMSDLAHRSRACWTV